MSARIFQLLEALPAHFASVAPSAAADEQAHSVAHKLATLGPTYAQAGLSGSPRRLEQ